MLRAVASDFRDVRLDMLIDGYDTLRILGRAGYRCLFSSEHDCLGAADRSSRRAHGGADEAGRCVNWLIGAGRLTRVAMDAVPAVVVSFGGRRGGVSV